MALEECTCVSSGKRGVLPSPGAILGPADGSPHLHTHRGISGSVCLFCVILRDGSEILVLSVGSTKPSSAVPAGPFPDGEWPAHCRALPDRGAPAPCGGPGVPLLPPRAHLPEEGHPPAALAHTSRQVPRLAVAATVQVQLMGGGIPLWWQVAP